MDRRRRIAIWVVAMLAVVGLVLPLALAVVSVVDGEDEVDGTAVIGNDAGRPVPVAPDGELYTVAPNECALGAINPTSVVGVEELDDPIRAVRELGAQRLFDVWEVSTETLTPPSRAVTAPVDRLWVDAGTDLPALLDEDRTVFGVRIEGDRDGDLYVLAVGRTAGDDFRFEWPCADVLNLEWDAVAEALDRPADEALAIEFLLSDR